LRAQSVACRVVIRHDYSLDATQKYMTDQPPAERFKPDMPQIPGVQAPGSRRAPGTNIAVRLVAGLLGVLIVLVLGTRWILRPKHVETVAAPPPQIEVPAPAPDPNAALPHATETEPGIATIAEMTKPWSTKDFFMRNHLTGDNVPALLVRLPAGPATQPSGYWAFATSAPYGNSCQLEYIRDPAKLANEYGFRGSKHPMVGNPCSRSVFDPLKLTNLPGNVWVRGGIVQGSDLRPPIGIEVQIQGKEIQAVRME
jgi:hypothetical protein